MYDDSTTHRKYIFRRTWERAFRARDIAHSKGSSINPKFYRIIPINAAMHFFRDKKALTCAIFQIPAFGSCIETSMHLGELIFDVTPLCVRCPSLTQLDDGKH